MSKDQRFSIEYLGGIYGQRKEKTGSLQIGSAGLHISFGLSNDKNFTIPWQAVVAISMTGSTNPAYQVVPKALYGFPGLQSVSSKTVKTGAKCFVSISYARWADRALYDSTYAKLARIFFFSLQ